mgnify:FL=1
MIVKIQPLHLLQKKEFLSEVTKQHLALTLRLRLKIILDGIS